MSTLKCMNCGKDVLAGQSKIFAQVLVCSVCYEIAKSFYEKTELELKNLQLLLKESIRVALVQGKFRLSEAKVRDISKKELLEEILKLETARGTK